MSNPAYWGDLKSSVKTISAANTNRDGSTGTRVDLVTGTANGVNVLGVSIQAVGTVTAGVVRLWKYDGSNAYLLREVLIEATVPDTATEAESKTWTPPYPFTLRTNEKLQASTHNAEEFDLHTSYGEQ